jgi:hypothetical protein
LNKVNDEIKIKAYENRHTIYFGELFTEEDKWYLQTNIQLYESDQFVDILKRYTYGETTE